MSAQVCKSVEDTRYVYGAFCFWSGPISEAGKNQSGLPCCPHCSSPLFELDNEAQWWEFVQKHEREMQPGYEAFLRWVRKSRLHFGNYRAALLSYKDDQPNSVMKVPS